MGVGISLITSSQKLVAQYPWSPAEALTENWIAVLVLFLLFASVTSRRIPLASIFFFVGLAVALFRLQQPVTFGARIPGVIIPTWADFKVGFLEASIAQLPLTVLNSIIAVVAVSEDLLPLRDAPDVTHLGLSIGIMNLTGCLFGSMPVSVSPFFIKM